MSQESMSIPESESKLAERRAKLARAVKRVLRAALSVNIDYGPHVPRVVVALLELPAGKSGRVPTARELMEESLPRVVAAYAAVLGEVKLRQIVDRQLSRTREILAGASS
jgi:hypothetical protein